MGRHALQHLAPLLCIGVIPASRWPLLEMLSGGDVRKQKNDILQPTWHGLDSVLSSLDVIGAQLHMC